MSVQGLEAGVNIVQNLSQWTSTAPHVPFFSTIHMRPLHMISPSPYLHTGSDRNKGLGMRI